MEVSGKRKVGRPRTTRKDRPIVKSDWELLGVDENVALCRRRWRKIIPSPTTSLGKILTLNKNDDDDDDTF